MSVSIGTERRLGPSVAGDRRGESPPMRPLLLACTALLSIACGGGHGSQSTGDPRPAGGAASESVPGSAGRVARDGQSADGRSVRDRSVHDRSAADPWCLSTRRERRIDSKPEWAVSADLDGDGLEELLVATLVPGQLRALDSRGGADRWRIPVGDYPLRPLSLGGGRIAVASRAERSLAWYRIGEQARQETRLELAAVPRALGWGDLGNDGEGEIVIACDGPQLLVISDAGRREEPRSLRLEETLPRCLHVLSDGSGVLVGFQSTRSLRFFPYREGHLAAGSLSIPLEGIPRDITEGDLDGDGDGELLVVGGEDRLWVFGWRGRALLTDPPLTWPVAPIPIAARVVDGRVWVLHVGRLELAVLDRFPGPGESSLPRRRTGYAGQTPRDLLAADLDGDGRTEAVIVNRDSRAVSLIPGEEPGPAFASRTRVGGFPSDVARGDLNEDGSLDLVVLNSKDASASVLLARGGKLENVARLPVGPAPRGARLADLDGDGHLDLLLLTVDAAGGRIVRLFGDGSGALTRRPEAGDIPAGAAPSDLLFLGERLFVIDGERDEARVFTPKGKLAWSGPLPSGPRSIEAIDFDGDGNEELAIALGGSGRRGVLIAEWTGDRLTERTLIPVPGAPLDLAVADLDGDGVVDLALLSLAAPDAKQGGVQPLFLDGRGGAVAGKAEPVSLAPRQLAAADLDGDGRAELLVAAQFAHVIDLFTCEGRRLVRRDGIGVGVGPMAVTVIDADGDGRLDVVGVNGHSDDVSLVLARR